MFLYCYFPENHSSLCFHAIVAFPKTKAVNNYADRQCLFAKSSHSVNIATVPQKFITYMIFILLAKVCNSNLYQETPLSACLVSITCHGKNFCFQIQHFNLMIICVCNIHQAAVSFNTQTSRFIKSWLCKAGTDNIACFSCACQGRTVLHLGIYNLNLRLKETQKS